MRWYHHLIQWASILWLTLMLYARLNLQLSPARLGEFVGLFNFLIPIIFLIGCVFWLYWLIQQNVKWSIVFTIALLGNYSLLSRSFAFGNLLNSSKTADFQVLSYNVRVFNSYPHLANEDFQSSLEMLEWLANHPAEVKCLQEFYHLEASETFNTIDKLSTQKNYNYWAGVELSVLNSKQGFFGNIILSKYPIIHKGTIPIDQKSIFADIVFPQDTIRVINVHLKSMHLNLDQMEQSEILSIVSQGLTTRATQVDILRHHIQKSPHPVLLCGDFNEIPFGYVYEQLNWELTDTFTQSNAGLGTTFRGAVPLLRIDYQFYDHKHFQAQNLSIEQNMTYSDHLPLVGKYVFRE